MPSSLSIPTSNAGALVDSKRPPAGYRCVRCDGDRFGHYVSAPHADSEVPHDYYRCRNCGLVCEDPRRYAAQQIIAKPVSELTGEDREAFRKMFVESIDISDGDGHLYPDFQFTEPEAMPTGIFQAVNRHIARVFTPNDAFSALEVGCADGFLLRKLRESYPRCQTLGIEPSPVSCEKARRLGTDVRQGTLDTVDLRGARFDLALCVGNLMLHENPVSSLRHMTAALRPGGLLVFDVKNARSTIRLLAKALHHLPGARRVAALRKVISQSYENMRFPFSKRDLRGIVAELGLELRFCGVKPPRQLAFENKNGDSRGLRGLAWRLLDGIDQARGERAWIEICAVKPAASALKNQRKPGVAA